MSRSVFSIILKFLACSERKHRGNSEQSFAYELLILTIQDAFYGSFDSFALQVY